MKSLQLITIITAIFGAVLTGNAQGLIGTNHISAGGGYSSAKLNIQGVKIESDSGYNLSLSGNFSLYEEYGSDYGLDLIAGVGYSKVRKDDSWTTLGTVVNGSLSSTNVQAALRPYLKLDDQFKLFVQTGLGWTQGKYKENHKDPYTGAHVLSGSSKLDGFAWGIGAGIEFVIDAFSIQGTVTYVDGFDSKISSAWQFGIGANYWINEKWGIGAAYGYGDSDEKGSSATSHTISGSVRFRF